MYNVQCRRHYKAVDQPGRSLLLNDALRGDWSCFLPCWLRTGRQSAISQEKVAWDSATAENWTWTTEIPECQMHSSFFQSDQVIKHHPTYMELRPASPIASNYPLNNGKHHWQWMAQEHPFEGNYETSPNWPAKHQKPTDPLNVASE